MAVYAVSDLHGQFNTFMAGLEETGFNDDDTLYVIGDAIDRGPEGIKLLRYIKEHENMDLIIGNHEFMMLNSVDPDGKEACHGTDSFIWLIYNGGDKTLNEYYGLSEPERKELLAWLNDRYVTKIINVSGKDFCLTHSFFIDIAENKKYSELDYGTVSDIVWNSIFRDDPDTHADFIYDGYAYTFITGHVPTVKIRYDLGSTDLDTIRIYEKENLIDIDGGCAYGKQKSINNGALFLRLDDMKVFPIPVK
ncbi:MAG: fructose-bisphosphatase class III [Lachnospiraceae bacterium]|nr:fructose-bisphosphatase class III [Lachnospiraceae bacterium]